MLINVSKILQQNSSHYFSLEEFTMDIKRPHSLYSLLVIHIYWKLEMKKYRPPIQAEYFLSGLSFILSNHYRWLSIISFNYYTFKVVL
ncbi:unnamed protein product [Blepharisma stoltei]|uniref:Uncharacterized protein n=1 Tax=Blepharisma stoltei TaxID=1481888 RepID=A0AAU9J4J8_9CILI|nr:unnamed protein product [Blepharisma stoltei]